MINLNTFAQRALIFRKLKCLLLALVVTSSLFAQKQARKADDFVNSIGVNTHFGYTDKVYFSDFDALKLKLNALGIKHIRDGVDDRSDVYNKINELYTSYGIKVNQGVGPRKDSDFPWEGMLDPSKIDGQLAIIKAHYVNCNESIEGPNEYDITHGSATVPDPDWTTTLRSYTQTLYNKVKADAVLKNRPVIGPAMAEANQAPAVGNISQYMDRGNFHPYPGGQAPSGGLYNYNIPNTQNMTGSKTLWATETGYHNAQDQENCCHYYAPESVTGKYGPRLIAEYFRAGIERAYFYELINLGTNSENREDNFGLLRNDLTEKPIYGAIRNTISLLKDQPGGNAPGTLNYTLSGSNLTNIREVLLQKTNGKFYLLIWQEVSSYNRDTRTILNPAAVPVTLNLPVGVATAKTYLPTNSTTVVNTYNNPRTISLQVPDQLMIVELSLSDLIVTDISWTPANPTPGAAVTLSAVIKNQGVSATPASVIHGVQFSINGAVVNWSDNSTASLAAGASRTVTATSGFSGTPTWAAGAAGSYTVLANVDDVNRMAESNENNNTRSETLTIGSSGIFTVDNTDAGFSTKGTWTTTTSPTGYWGSNYLHDGGAGWNTTDTATWVSPITATANYDVYMRWAAASDRPDAAPVQVNYNGGVANLTVNQRINGGTWFKIGTWSFTGGSGDYVRILASDDGTTVADAVRWVPAGAAVGAMNTPSNRLSSTILEAETINSGLQVYPNPASGSVNLSFSAESAGQANIEIYSGLGQKVFSASKAVSQGKNNLKVDLNDIQATGMYYIKVISGGKVMTQTLMINK